MNNEDKAEVKEEGEQEEPGEQLAPAFSFVPKENHDWRQQSIFLVCKSCEIQHAVYIGPNKMLVGMNDQGQPILIDRKEYGTHFKKKK